MDGLDITKAWLRLNALEFRPLYCRALLDAFDGSPSVLFAASVTEWRERLPKISDKQIDRLCAVRDRAFDKELALLERLGARVVTHDDPVYPFNLRQLTDAPLVLIVRGELAPEDKFGIAIVGSRRASEYGLALAKRFARDLAAHGLTIISGGARGVDTQAHQGALECGGRTIVFLGCGVDVHYPAENRGLFDRIARGGGAVVSEFPLGTTPEPWRFPSRNRLISGTALGVLVVESPVDSGSLITAREAADQGRDVFAIPGSIGTGLNAGCHRLIQEGAKLVETVEDILNELGVLTLRSPAEPGEKTLLPAPPQLPPEQRRILDLLALQPRHVDGLITESGLTAPQVTGILTLLEMRGLARRVPGNAFVRVL